MTTDNNQTGQHASTQQSDEQDVRDQPTPNYSDALPERGENREGGEINQSEPAWRPGDNPAGQTNSDTGQTESEPGRSRQDTDGVEEVPENQRAGDGEM